MRNSKLKYILLLIFLFQLISLAFMLFPNAVHAVDLQVKIPTDSNAGASIGAYVAAIYKYAVGAIGILATVVMMGAGILWMMAGGNPERVANAKTWITGAITGLLLAVTSYTILYLVNPNLVKFREIKLNNIPTYKICCSSSDGQKQPLYDKSKNEYVCIDSIKCNDGQQCIKSGSTYTCSGTKNQIGCCAFWSNNYGNLSAIPNVFCSTDEFTAEECENQKDIYGSGDKKWSVNGNCSGTNWDDLCK